MARKPNVIARECLRFTGLFEAELLARLLLERWGHPLGNDTEFIGIVVENAREVLQQSVLGTQFIEGLPPNEMNYVAAVWYFEWAAIASDPSIDRDGKRDAWLRAVRRALPSCFCDQDELPPSID